MLIFHNRFKRRLFLFFQLFLSFTFLQILFMPSFDFSNGFLPSNYRHKKRNLTEENRKVEIVLESLNKDYASTRLIVITPTHKTAAQMAHLVRLKQTLQLVPNCDWIVVQDASKTDPQVFDYIKNFNSGLKNTPRVKTSLIFYDLTNSYELQSYKS